MYSNKASKGRVDQKYAKIAFKTVSLLKFCTFHDIAYEAHFSLIEIIYYFQWAVHRPEILPSCYQGDTLPWKTISKTLFDLGNIFSWPKYGNAPAAASRAVIFHVMRNGLRSPIQLWKNMGNMSNESSNSALLDAHTHYWAQIPYWWRIEVCRSIHAAAEYSWPNNNETPSKALKAQFDLVNYGLNLKW